MRDESWPIARSERPYIPLTDYLAAVADDEDAVLSFDDIADLIGRELPIQARSDDAWWGSNPRHP